MQEDEEAENTSEVAYYHRSGDVLPNMVEIQEGLLSRKARRAGSQNPSEALVTLAAQ